jgi:hypothetical protein
MRDLLLASLAVCVLGCDGSSSRENETDAATRDTPADGSVGQDASNAQDGGTQGGSSDAGEGSADAGGNAVPARDRPKLSVRRIKFSGHAVFTQPGDTVELVGIASGKLYRIALDGTLSEPLHTFAVAPTMAPPPVAVIDADGALHLFWEAARSVRHASNRGGTWAEEELARGSTPAALLAPDGRLLVAYAAPGGVGASATATLASLESAGWTKQAVADIDTFSKWVGLALGPDSEVLVAGVRADGSVWVQREESVARFVDIGLDISEHVARGVSAKWALGAGPAGIALHFSSNGNYVAYRAAEASSFTVSGVGPAYSLSVYPSPAVLAPATGATLSLVDYERIVVLSPGNEVWPILAAVPWPDCADGNTERHVSAGADGQGRLLLAAKGCDGLELFYEDGSLDTSWESVCTALVDATCEQACRCGGESECSFLTAYTNTGYTDHSGNLAGCQLDARTSLCWNSTRTVTEMRNCTAAFARPEACVTPGYPLPDVCQALSQVD